MISPAPDARDSASMRRLREETRVANGAGGVARGGHVEPDRRCEGDRHVPGMYASPIHLLESRITSYNVCYTKLLRAIFLSPQPGLIFRAKFETDGDIPYQSSGNNVIATYPLCGQTPDKIFACPAAFAHRHATCSPTPHEPIRMRSEAL